MTSFAFRPRGPFALEAAARFAEAFPGTRVDRDGGRLRMAWAVDDDWRTVVATIRATAATVRVQVDAPPPADLRARARRDVERILSLDVDGAGFAALADRDPVVAGLQRRYPGRRPVLFPTPYEAAAWAIIGHRVRMTQAARVKGDLADALGTRGAFPAPERLATLRHPLPGLTGQKVERLAALGRSAAAGQLSRDRLRALPYDAALADLQELPGVGPFSAELVLIRGAGLPDVPPVHEGRFATAVRHAYGLGDDVPVENVADGWRPFRAWVAHLLRAWLDDGRPDLSTTREPP